MPVTGVSNASWRKQARFLENRRLVRAGQFDIAGHAAVLALSRTYVNLSGEAAGVPACTVPGRPGAVDCRYRRHKPAPSAPYVYESKGAPVGTKALSR